MNNSYKSTLTRVATIHLAWPIKCKLHEPSERQFTIAPTDLKIITSSKVIITPPTISWPGTIGDSALPYP